MANQSLDAVVKSDKGRVKEINQDNFLIKIGRINNDDVGLFAICDGLGGLSKGEVASKKVVHAFEEWWNTKLYNVLRSNLQDKEILMELGSTLKKVNDELIMYSSENDIKMGTTASILLILRKKFYICHIGDSRIYAIDKKVNKLTKDHTYYNKLIEEGNIEKSKTVKKSILTQCVGVNKEISPNFIVGELFRDTFFLLCSDGFYKRVTEDELMKIKYEIEKTSDYGYMDEICKKYVELIINKGERDNISVVAVKFKISEEE